MSKDKRVPTEFVINLMRHVLNANVFEFNNKLYLQLIGTAMGTSSAPTISNIYMASINILILDASDQIAIHLIILFVRFIDDGFKLWTGTQVQHALFMIKINSIHPNLKFTSSCKFEERSTTFLNLTVNITGNTIITDLYRKQTDRVQYLLPSSCHPAHTFKNIPFSLALRLVRICSRKEDLDKRFDELRSMLKIRKYNSNIVIQLLTKPKKLIDKMC